MRSTQVPNMTVTSSGVSVKCAGQIDMYADTKGKQKPFLVTLYAVSLLCLLERLKKTGSKVIKLFHAQLNWARNFNCLKNKYAAEQLRFLLA